MKKILLRTGTAIFPFVLGLMLVTLLFVSSSYAYGESIIDELFSSTPEELFSSNEPNDFLVGGLVNPLNGAVSLQEVDLVAKGAQSIELRRVFRPYFTPIKDKDKGTFSKKSRSGWVIFPHTRLNLCTLFSKNKIKQRQACVVDPNGSALVFSIENGTTSLTSKTLGISNGASERPSGKNDPRNTSIEVKNNYVIVRTPDGYTRYYEMRITDVVSDSKSSYDCRVCFLEKEILPNGKVLKYYYHMQDLCEVRSLDPQEKHIYATLYLDSSLDNQISTFRTNSGLSSSFQHQTKIEKKENKLKKNVNLLSPMSITQVDSPRFSGQKMSYETNTFLFEPTDRQYLSLCGYEGRKHHFKIATKEFRERKEEEKMGVSFRKRFDSSCRVEALYLPDCEGNFEKACYFFYNAAVPGISSGETTVKHWNGSKTVYQINPNMLPSSIKYYNEENNLLKQKVYNWNENQWIESIEIRDGKNRLEAKKSFQYDSFGNPILETFEGELSSPGQFESYIIHREYSVDGRNLLLRELYEEGKEITYAYVPNTNLLKRKVIKDKGQELFSEEYEFDEFLNLVRKIEGQKGKEKITRYILRQQQPFLHMPEWVEESYSDENGTQLLKRTKLAYDEYGNIAEEEVYGADNRYYYTIKKEYNESGDLLSETNALGHKASYKYDNHGWLKSEIAFPCKSETVYEYDLKGRQTARTEIGLEDAICFKQHNNYDLNDCVVKKLDSYGNETRFVYDTVFKKIKTIQYPDIIISNDVIPVSVSYEYDDFGREIAKVDRNGFKTSYRNNAYGSHFEIAYPDNTKETYTYYKNGEISSHLSQEGLKTSYKYDGLSRVIEKSFSQNNTILAKETFVYDGMYLVQFVDKEGKITKYFYDGAGRKVAEECGRKRTQWTYSPLGYVQTICEGSGKEALFTHFERDYLGQTLKTSYCDHAGHVLKTLENTFDSAGNISTSKQNVDGNASVKQYEYDSQNRLISYTDPLGYVTLKKYEDDYLDLLDRKVLRKSTISPNQVLTREIYDPFGRVVSKQVFNPNKGVIASEDKEFDPSGNMVSWTQDVYHDDRYVETKKISYKYDAMNRRTKLTRGASTPYERNTSFSYTPAGQVASKTLPDNTVLKYKYNPFGQLIHVSSSDGNISHSFYYDLLGNLKRGSDNIEKISFERELDVFGNILSERFYNGSCIKKSYDSFDRPLSVILDDGSKICYSYDPLYLRKVQRFSSRGDLLYQHTYDNYDASGNLLSETLIGRLGSVDYTLNPKGLVSSIKSDYLSEECMYDEIGNLISLTSEDNEKRFHYTDLDQLEEESDGKETRTYAYDSTNNRIAANDALWSSNPLDEIEIAGQIKCDYDLRGNLRSKSNAIGTTRYSYDSLNRLISIENEASKIRYRYDPLGRRISKAVYQGDKKVEEESYLYDGREDIGTLDSQGKLKHLSVLGLVKEGTPRPVAIELGKKVYLPIIDCQANVHQLIDLALSEVAARYEFTSFGENVRHDVQIFNPWQFACKRFDVDSGLIDYGKRYYLPELGRWLTTDPAEFLDGSNLYTFLRNNPYRYVDPDGQFAFVIPFVVCSFTLGGEIAIGLATAEVIGASLLGAALGYGAYEMWQKMDLGEGGSEVAGAISGVVQDQPKEKKKPGYRTEPLDLEEQLALEEAKHNKGKGIMDGKLNDPNYPPDKWTKKREGHNHPDGTVTEVHYWEEIETGERSGFKIKDEDNNKSRSKLYE